MRLLRPHTPRLPRLHPGCRSKNQPWERDDFTITFPTGVVANLSSNTRSGWTVGIGGEYAFTNWFTGFVEL
jgi:hypothetical protein